MGEAPTARQQAVRGFAALFIVLGLLAALAYGLVLGLNHLRSGVAAALVTASATILISVFSVIYSRRADQRRAIEQANREQKLPVYEELIRVWFRSSFDTDQNPDEVAARWREYTQDFNQKLMLWISEPVLAAYTEFRRVGTVLTAEELSSSATLLFAFENLVLAVRRDLGHSNKDVRKGDILRMWINDIDTYLPTASLGAG